MKKDLAYYRSLPYRRTIRRFMEEEDGEIYFCVSFAELPHVKGIHTNHLEALRLAHELFDAYVQAQLEWGEPIPEPETGRKPKRGGRWTFAARRVDVAGGGAEKVRHSGFDEATATSSGSETRIPPPV